MELTIFTPVYNRVHLIDRLYKSLQRQSDQRFIWLIVDDGSEDDLCRVVERYRGEADFEIRYYYQKNQGKHIAHNTGVEKCDTELFFCVDSDDYLPDDAVEKIYAVHSANRSRRALGYYFRKMDTKGNISGGDFTVKGGVVGLRELYYRYGFVGELAIILKTDLIRGYSFPSYENERFVSEKVFYNQITSVAPMIYVDDVIYIFEYQEMGYTQNSNRLLARNPKGAAMGYLSDAVYGLHILDRAKAFAAFLSMKRVFGIPRETYPEYRINPVIKWLALPLKPHYNRLFRRMDLQYNEEEK